MRFIKYNQLLKTLAILCFTTIFIYFVCGIIISPKLSFFSESANMYDEEWIKENPDGTVSRFKMPTSLNLNDGESVTFSTVLPDNVESGMYLALNTGKSFSASIDGKEICTFDNRISRLPGNITKTVIVPIELEDEYAGKTLVLDITNGKYDRVTINTAYIGSLLGIVRTLISNYALQFVMAMLLILASLLTIVIFAYIGRRDNKRASLIYLSEGILLICAWIVCDSPLFQMVFGTYFVDGVTGFMFVTTMGMPFLLYFDAITENRDHKVFAICESIIVINFIVLTILHLTGIRSYDKSLIYVDMMLLIYIVVMVVATLRDYFIRKDNNHKFVVIGLIGLSLFSFMEIVITIVNASIPFKIDLGGMFVIVGMIFLLVCAIVDQAAVYENLKLESQNAIAATKAKSDFLANMSHEIRTPINAIMGMNQMVIRESDQESVREYAKDISSASDNLLKIVNDILDFSKIESGKLEIVNDNYNLGELIYGVTTLVNMKAEDKGLKLEVSVDENMPYKLYGDDKRVREIITNILNNAVKYTQQGFVKLNIGGTVENSTLLLNIRVEDSGQGIKREDINNIFDGFSRVNVKKNKNIEGTGLGLSITKRLVELMNGQIEVKSEFGVGSVFTVFLPQQIVSDDKMGNYISHRHVSTEKTGLNESVIEIPDVNILVVDDTALNLKVISKLLSKTKAVVTCAASGEEMLNLIQEERYDIIFLDHMMPEMDGIETLKKAGKIDNNKCKNTPVIALTANAIIGAKEMYLEAGFTDYLSKPVKMDDLCNMIIRYTK